MSIVIARNKVKCLSILEIHIDSVLIQCHLISDAHASEPTKFFVDKQIATDLEIAMKSLFAIKSQDFYFFNKPLNIAIKSLLSIKFEARVATYGAI